jgi:prevent-host-death family protein
MPQVLSATEAKVRFGEVLRNVAERDEVFVVERSGRPQAVILSLTEYRRLVDNQRQPEDWRDKVLRVREAVRAELGGRVLPAPEEVIRDAREERDASLSRGI